MPTPVAVVLAIAAILLIIWQIRRNRSTEDSDTDAATAVQESVPSTAEAGTCEAGAEVRCETDQQELIAVLTAAVAAYMSGEMTGKFRVRSFRRIPTVSPIWNMVGRKELLERKL